MSSNIRKISIGSDYKSDAMHYATGQTVYGGHEISHILFSEVDDSYNVYIFDKHSLFIVSSRSI